MVVGFVAFVAGRVASAHGVGNADAAFLSGVRSPDPVPFLYLGAKHMVTGLDHLLFLVAVVLLLDRSRDVVVQVTIFSVGHSATLLGGMLTGFTLDPRLVDAIIGLSIVYKAIENAGVLTEPLRTVAASRLVLLGFGLVHGLGLAARLRDLTMASTGLVSNLLAFNVGVELAQILVLWIVLAVLAPWRDRSAFRPLARRANAVCLVVGLALSEGHFAAWILGAGG